MVNILSTLKNKARKEFSAPSLDAFRLGSQTVVAFTVLVGSVLFYSHSAKAITVSVSVPALAGIVAPILSKEDRIHIMLDPGVSPHNFQLKPSHIERLANSDLVLWVGTPVDYWLKKTLMSYSIDNLAMSELSGLQRLPVRQGGLWSSEDHKHGHIEHETFDAHTVHTKPSHSHAANHTTDVNYDGHLWMSLTNSLLMIKQVVKRLQNKYPQRANEFNQNAQAWLAKLTQADLAIERRLTNVKDVPYMVLHDGFQYFENRYGLNGIGSIQLNPSVTPSLKRVAMLRNKIQAGKVRCVFKEPQFPAKKIYSVVKGLDVKIGVLDPIGITSSKEAKTKGARFLSYDVFMKQLANQFYDCLSPVAQ